MNEFENYEHEGEQYVLIKDLAKKFYNCNSGKIPITEVRTKIKNNGHQTVKIPVTIDYDGIKKKHTCYAVRSNIVKDINELFIKRHVDGKHSLEGACDFYIIQLFPEDAPFIIKLGITVRGVEARSKQFYTFAPKILYSQKIDSLHESTLIAMITSGYKRLGKELFRVDDIDAFLEKAIAIVKLLPENTNSHQ